MEPESRFRSEKIYRGAYDYFIRDSIYSEETFDVYRNKKENHYKIMAQIHSRVATGELLTCQVEYVLNFKFVAQKVVINRALGNERSQEKYIYNKETNSLVYEFITRTTRDEFKIPTKINFHIATPSTATAMLFFKTKKFNATSTNSYNVISSTNTWGYENEPIIQTAALQRLSSTAENIKIGRSTVAAHSYRLTHDRGGSLTSSKKKKETPPHVKVYLSKYLAIPYIMRGDDGLRIQVKYFNNLDSDEN